ncbi:FkbM family methyltransferase [Massilia timonae]|uniref:FkbM family methyltransferase n=1 Tax=Massilia timonae CCUG 45783 TaxID=883126 RepID=K9E191_9BURK|nr:FkbM family methyltransferase [Massilia timonae]EKU83205.1 FkbM family methyltransferase [Massilia timonae CCUG 45783]
MNQFVSYAQNGEDVLLWRALGHVRHGFYIDVGANDPVEHSVTKAFYERGWRGVSIEPLPSFHQAFEEQRPHDVNLAIAAGAADGELTLYDVPAVRGWASPEQSVAEMHRAEGHEVAELTVPVRTLASICEEHVRGEIHFLKVDVEGFEGEVLRGMDFARWRPWVLVIEATLPNSRETNHESWEHLVTGQRYRFAWFDGLNRYYVAEEHAELLAHFGVQPNVFDSFISWHLDHAWAAERTLGAALQAAGERQKELGAQVERFHAQAMELLWQMDGATQRAEHAEGRAAVLTQELEQVHADAARLSAWAEGLQGQIAALENSTSWKITRPLRRAGGLARKLREPHLLQRVVKRLTRVELLRRLLIPILLRFPALGRRVAVTLVAVKQAVPDPLPADVAHVPDELRGLPVSVRTALADLQRARTTHTSS